MVSFCEQLVSEILFSSPSLSSEEISDQITTLIEKEILPETVRRIRLPSLPSPVSIKREELMKRRYGKAHVSVLKENLIFIQDLEKLRNIFNDSDLTNESFSFMLVNDTQKRFFPEVRYKGEEEDKLLSVEPDKIREKLKFSTSLDKKEGIIKKPSQLIIFDLKIKEKITHNSLFEKLIGEIESKIRKNYDYETRKAFFNFSTRIDMDDPDREKTIIHVSLSDYGFDEKMEFWNKIETDIRDTIKKLNITEIERKKINRNLYTHIE